MGEMLESPVNTEPMDLKHRIYLVATAFAALGLTPLISKKLPSPGTPNAADRTATGSTAQVPNRPEETLRAKSRIGASEPQPSGDKPPASKRQVEGVQHLIQLLTRYEALVNSLLDQNPEMKEIPALIAWLQRLRDSFPEAAEEWKEKAARSPDVGLELFQIMHLMKPTVMLAMMDDPKFGPIMKEVYETVGLRNQPDPDLRALDHLAGYSGNNSVGLEFQEFRKELEARELAYKRASEKVSRSLPEASSEDLGNYMFAEVQRGVMVPYLELYYDSLFPDEVVELAAQIRAGQRELHQTFQSSVVPPELLQQYKARMKRSPKILNR